ncbi:MAG: hypothetical protein JG781_1466 [Peptococcaceae bacterium]|nr:hypothetical protein [Peptococcaceae bacterium]
MAGPVGLANFFTVKVILLAQTHIHVLSRCGGVSMLIKISDLRDREIINVVDGRRLGPIKDIELDLEKGRIKAIVLPSLSGGRILGLFGRSDDIVVPWEKIVRIGVDVILVEVSGQHVELPPRKEYE